MSEDLEAIAAKLSPAQMMAMRHHRLPAPITYPRDHQLYAALERRGLLQFRHIMCGRGDFTLTELGQRLRDHMRAAAIRASGR